MAKKFTDLPELTTADEADVIPIDDISANATKKTTVAGLAAAVAANIPDGSISSAQRAGGFFAKVHTFNTGTGAQTITGIGFTPKAVLVQGLGRNSTSEGHSSTGFAFGNGSDIEQGGTSVYVAGSTPRTRHSTGSAFVACNAAGTGFIFDADITGFSDGTISVDVNTTIADSTWRTFLIMVFG